MTSGEDFERHPQDRTEPFRDQVPSVRCGDAPWGWSAGFLVAVLELTACSGTEGTAAATSANWSTPNGSPPPASASRPSELTVDDIRSCDLLTDDQRGKLGLTGEQTSKLSPTWSTNTCRTWDSARKNSASVTAVSNQGIDEFYRGRFANMQYKPTTVRDFPALYYRLDGGENACYLVADVADGHLVDVAFGASVKNSGQSQDEMCAAALGVMEAAMDTLLAKR